MTNDKTDITVILDRSGSMGDRREDAIGGFNALLLKQQAEPGDAYFSLIQFDDRYEPNYIGRSLKDVQPLTWNSYQPRGATALLDAIGRTINDTGQRLAAMSVLERPTKVIMCIITDGKENASSTFNRHKVNEMIAHQRDTYQWTFLFVGTNQDAINEAGRIGIPHTHAVTYGNSPQGYGSTYSILNDKFSNVRAATSPTAAFTAAAFTEEDRVKAAAQPAGTDAGWKGGAEGASGIAGGPATAEDDTTVKGTA
jgi:hypothetical protein